MTLPILRKIGALLACIAVTLLASLPCAVAQSPPARLSALATEPDWSTLDPFQATMTAGEFTRLLDAVYAPNGAWQKTIRVDSGGAHILTSGTYEYLLRFAGKAKPSSPAPYWEPIAAMPPAAKPLAGLKIALDPGHLGGDWAKMEERWFQIGPGTLPVAEGDMTLLTARLLAARLTADGATVLFVRNASGPITKLRPADLRDAARAQLKRQGMALIRDKYNGPADPIRMNSIQWTSELLFYRTAEIQERARLVNDQLKPDIVLCLHYNAEAWGDPANPQLVPKNHMHLLVNGCYSAPELSLDDVRYSMLIKLLSGCYAEELPVAEHIAASLAAATGLPPYQYTTPNAIRVGPNPYIWARDLLANRLYQCPVVYIEPYVMNSKEVWDRVQAGNYSNRRIIDGKLRESIYQEYARAVVAGLASAARDLRK